MKTKAILAVLAAVLLLPALASAQHAGFAVAFGSRGLVAPPVHHAPHLIIQNGSVGFIAPHAVKVAPGHALRLPSHPVAPFFGHHDSIFLHGRRGQHFGASVIQTAPSALIGRQVHGLHHSPIVIGMPRAHVIDSLGRPKFTIINTHGETLIFSNTTVVLRNGTVAVIR